MVEINEGSWSPPERMTSRVSRHTHERAGADPARGAPTRIAALTAGLTPGHLRQPSRNDWSANDVLAHLRACADVRGEPIVTIIAEDRPTLRVVNHLTWIKRTNYLELELLAVLEPLPHEG